MPFASPDNRHPRHFSVSDRSVSEARILRVQTTILESFFSLRRTEFGAAKPLIESRIFDPGLASDVTWTSPTGEALHTPARKIYNRQATFHIIKQHLFFCDTGCPPRVKFAFLDIESFQSMNIPDRRGVLGGDYYIGLLAGIFQTHVRAHPDNQDICFGRYGGDEFLFMFGGSFDDTRISEFFESLSRTLSQTTAYHHDRGRIVTRPLGLKSTPQIIDVPTDPTDFEVFMYYLRRNLLLNHEEVARSAADYFAKPGTGATQITSLLPSQIEEVVVNHPEYRPLVDLARRVDRQEATDSHHYTRRFLHYYQALHTDPLLNLPILPFGEFVETVATRPLTHLLTFDLKFVKELNDEFSLVRGDDTIIQYIESVMSLFAQEDWDQLTLSRRGGSFQVAIQAHTELTLESILNLQRFARRPQFEYRTGTHRLLIPLGFTKSTLSHYQAALHARRANQGSTGPNKRLVTRLIATNLGRSQEEFYRHLSRHITAHPDLCTRIAGDYHDLIRGHQPALREQESWNLHDLISVHLRGSKLIDSTRGLADRYRQRFRELRPHLEQAGLAPESLAQLVRIYEPEDEES